MASGWGSCLQSTSTHPARLRTGIHSIITMKQLGEAGGDEDSRRTKWNGVIYSVWHPSSGFVYHTWKKRARSLGNPLSGYTFHSIVNHELLTWLTKWSTWLTKHLHMTTTLEAEDKRCPSLRHEFQRGGGGDRFETRHYVILHVFIIYTSSFFSAMKLGT